jgi:hypothetical protein
MFLLTPKKLHVRNSSILEIEDRPLPVEQMVTKTCDRNENVQVYVGHNYTYWGNRKVQRIVRRILEDARVEKILDKPIVLRYVKKIEKEEQQTSKTFSHPSDTTDTTDRPLDTSENENGVKNTENHKNECTGTLSVVSDMSDMSDDRRTVIEDPSKEENV